MTDESKTARVEPETPARPETPPEPEPAERSTAVAWTTRLAAWPKPIRREG